MMMFTVLTTAYLPDNNLIEKHIQGVYSTRQKAEDKAKIFHAAGQSYIKKGWYTDFVVNVASWQVDSD